MKLHKEISARVREMLKNDNMNLQQGFLSAFSQDVNHLLQDYFEGCADAKIDIQLLESGSYKVSIETACKRIKTFCTTTEFLS